MMESTNNKKFLLPSPNFDKKNNAPTFQRPHFLTPSGMTLLPREKQPPPMYGPRGPTVPPKYMNKYQQPQNKATQEQKPEQTNQYCEACDMEIYSLEELRRHRSQHEPCPVDGCKYRGHALVMDKHVTMFHSSGLFDKVQRLNTPEEIAAWRNERRKKFPTLANILQRQAAKEERMRRGERLEANKNRFGKREDRKRPNDMPKPKEEGEEQADNKKQKNKQNKRQKKRRAKNSSFNRPIKEIMEKSDDEDGILRFRGTSKMLDYEHMEAKKTTNALGTLCMYASSEEEETEVEYEKSNDKIQTNEKQKLQNSNEIDLLEKVKEEKVNCNSSDEAPDEAPVDRISNHPVPEPNTLDLTAKTCNSTEKSVAKTPPIKKKFQRKSGLNYGILHRRRQHTMLEKLLEHDIRHERNVLLQCVRFVVDHNFFGIGSKPES